MNIKRKNITLTLTQKCNLNCTYCYENHKSSAVMSFDLAKSVLDKELNDPKFEEYEIDFFGGEPFLAFDVIKKCYNYVTETYPQKKLIFFATTNGTLVHGEIQEWLKERKHRFWCALSLDGTKETHDKNRLNSFDLIDRKFFLECWPEQDLKMTISQNTLDNLADDIIFLHNEGFRFTANLAFGIDWSKPDNVNILERELKKIIDFYITHPDIEPCSLFQIPIFKVAVLPITESLRQCGAGIEMVSYDVDGLDYPCQFFMPLSVGNKASLLGNIDFPDMITLDHLCDDCKKCPAVAICHTCYGANYASTGNIFLKEDNWCRLQKIIFRANAYLKAQQLENNCLSCPEEEKYYLLKAILIISEQLV